MGGPASKLCRHAAGKEGASLTAFKSFLQYVTRDGLKLICSDLLKYCVKLTAFSGDDYFEDAQNSNENLNTITFGSFVFSGSDVKSIKLHNEIGLLTDSLAIDTMTAEVQSDIEPTVTRETAIKVKRGSATLGTYYNGQIKQIGVGQYQIYAESAITLLDYVYNNGGIYKGVQAGEIIGQLMGGIPHTIDPEISVIKLYGYLPRTTCRSNLQQVILATGAAIRKGDDGMLNITILTKTVVSTFENSKVFEDGAGVENDTAVTSLQVTEHSYLPSDEAATLCSDTFIGEKEIVFDEPMYNLECTGGDILDSSANHATINGRGPVTLTGKKYAHTTKIISKGATAAGDDKIYTVSDATLINPLNSASVADRLYKYAVCNKTIKQDVLIANERPGDLVTVIDPHKPGKSVKAAIQSLDYSLSNTVRASGTFLVGYEPVGIATGYKNRVVITNNGDWTVPDGINSMRVVVIGGGQGGAAGNRGETGEKGSRNITINEYMQQSSRKAGGAGGAGGTGGIGGGVLDVAIECTPGEKYSVSIGAGGAGGTTATGTLGGNTTFGNISSANGIIGAYVDVSSGDVYAEAGSAGINGGNGDGEPHGTYVIDSDNVWWRWGEKGSSQSKLIKDEGYYNTYSLGECGWGGGSAVGSDGGVGGNGNASSKYRYGGTGGNGGTGASSVIPGTNATIPGCGGNGGHGGGGGGAGGSAGGPISGESWAGSGGTGGNGSAGGNGAPGCVIIYY